MSKPDYTPEELEIERARIERNLRLTIEERLDQATINPIRPGIDDGTPWRTFATMADYKAWCATLPKHLGYGPAEPDTPEDT